MPTTYYDPTPQEIAARQRADDAERLKAYPGWDQRTSPDEARRAIVIEHAAAQRRENDAKGYEKYRARLVENDEVAAKGAEVKDAAESKAAWSQKYEVASNSDGSVSYARGGQERIVDRGDRVSIIGDDKESIRDAVRLAREKFGERDLQVNISDEGKRDVVLPEMARQGIKVANPELQEKYAELRAKIEKERAASELSRRLPERTHANEAENEYEV